MKKTEYEKYCELRDKLGLKDSDVAKGSGITKSTFSDWKAGRYVPKAEKLDKIEDFLEVKRGYLKSNDTDNEYYINPETAKVAQEIFENRDLRVLFDAAKDATPEDLQTTYNMLMALKKKERGIID